MDENGHAQYTQYNSEQNDTTQTRKICYIDT
jgi:hypothetical protein